MKRLCLLFLLTAVLLTACSTPLPTATTASTEASVTESTLAPTVQTESITPVETEPPTQAAVPQFYVQGDFSAYSEKETLEPLFTRPSGGSSGTLTALSEPTTLYPFEGSILRQSSYVNGYLHGLIDPSGRIVVEPIYSNISFLIDYQTLSRHPFWVLEQARDPEEVENNWYTPKYGLVSLDGTFMLDCKYDFIEVLDDRIQCSYHLPDSYETSVSEFYDFAGNLRLSTKDFPIAADLWYSNYLDYGEGLYVVCLKLTEESQESALSDHGYYYMTEEGEILYGPFADARRFCNGFAVVTLPDDTQTFLRKDGTLFPQRYAYAGQFDDGSAAVETLQGDWLNINTAGEIIETPTPFTLPDGSTYIQDYSDDGSSEVYKCYDETNKLLWTRPCENIISRNFYSWYDWDKEYTVLENPLTGKQISLPGHSFVEYTHTPSDPYVRVHTYPEGQPHQVLIITPQMETFAVIESYKDGSAAVSFLTDENSYTPCFALRNGKEVTLYRSPNEPVGTYSIGDFHKAIIYPGGIVSFTTDLCTEFYHPDGTLFFRYLINPMDD